jgi:hypothetical protein
VSESVPRGNRPAESGVAGLSSKESGDLWRHLVDLGAGTDTWDLLLVAIRAERLAGRQEALEEVLRGLRSEDDTTQIRAVIGSVEWIRDNPPREVGVAGLTGERNDE